MIGAFINRAIERLLPSRCAVCSTRGVEGSGLCYQCQIKLPRLENGCTTCASPLETSNPVVCGRCQQNPPFYDHTIAPFLYKEPVDHLITGLKFSARLAHARTLAVLFIDTLNDNDMPKLIIPMPLHSKRLRERGFNQSLEMARLISQKTGIPLETKACIRTRDTAPQSTLPAKEKKSNVKNAFAVNKPINEKHVAIVDDVMTSGHTVNELAKTLKAHGVERVDIWVMARAGRYQK